MLRPMRIAVCAIVAGSLLLASCGDDTDIEPGAGTFTGEMTGAYAATLDGQAQFGVIEDASGTATGFALVLGDGSVARILLTASNTPEPPARTYEIVAPGFPVGSDTVFKGSIAYLVNGAVEEFEARGGTVSLTLSAHNTAAGTFELRAERTSPCCDPAPVQVVITGTFDAAQFPQVF